MKVIFSAKLNNGKIDYSDKDAYQTWIDQWKDGQELEVEIKKHSDRRTSQQNNALHLYFTRLSDALNEAGQDIKEFLQVDVPWTPTLVKEIIWRRVQEMYLKKASTTELNKLEDITAVYEIVNRAVGERAKVYVPFPSLENQLNKLDNEKENQ